jgi:predicted metal-dependent peptidase
MDARKRIGEIVEKWFLVEPLFFAVWTGHELAVNPRIRTIRVRRGRIEYQPEFIAALGRRQLEEVLQMEAMRIVLKHPYARRRENADLSYAASNLTLQEYLNTTLPLPRARDVFGHDQFDRQYFEFYYHKLIDAGLAAFPSAGGDANAAVVYADPSTSGQENTEDWDADELLADAVNNWIRTAQETDRWGSIAGRWKDRILAGLNPKLNYRAVLRQFRASILSIERRLTRMKPNRRYGFLYMGSRYDFTTRLLFAVDVSGSMQTDDLRRGFSAVNQFFKYGVPSIDVVQFDTELKGPPVSWKRARREILAVGRGGTSFAPVIEFLDEHRQYDGAILFTDGYAPQPRPPKNRRTRLLWLFNTEASHRRMAPQLRKMGRTAFLNESYPTRIRNPDRIP